MTRSWACNCCGRTWARRRSERDAPFECMRCKRRLVAAHTPRERRVCVHDRAVQRFTQWQEKYASVPRTRSGHVFRVTPAMRAAWREVRRAKTKPSIVRRAQTFVDAVLAASRDDVDRSKGVRWRYERRLVKGKLEVHKSSGGFTGTPRVVLSKLMTYEYGVFRSGFGTHGFRYEIAISADVPDRDHMRETIVHELLHVLDHDAHIDDGHGSRWAKRLARMQTLFKSSELR